MGIDVGSTVPAELGLIQARSLRIQGIVGSAGIWPQAIRFLASGVVDPTPIVTARYPLGARHGCPRRRPPWAPATSRCTSRPPA